MMSFQWLAIFTQGCLQPLMMGIVLMNITPLERPVASALAVVVEMIGQTSSPYIYGLIIQET